MTIPIHQSTKNLKLMNFRESITSSKIGTGMTLYPTTRLAMAKKSNLCFAVSNAIFRKTVTAQLVMLLFSIFLGMTERKSRRFVVKSVRLISLQLKITAFLKQPSFDALTARISSFLKRIVSTLLYINV